MDGGQGNIFPQARCRVDSVCARVDYRVVVARAHARTNTETAGQFPDFFPVGHVFDRPGPLRRSTQKYRRHLLGTRTPHRTAVLESFRAQDRSPVR